MINRPRNIFNEGPCLTAEELLAYAEGRLSGAEAHRAERHLLECEFCAEALEGIAASGNARLLPQITNDLNERIDKAAGNKTSSGAAGFYYRRIAAVAALLIVAGGLWVYIGRMNRSEKLFSQYYEPYHQQTDSVAAQPAAGAFTPSQPPPPENEKQEIRSTNSSGYLADKKTLKEEKSVEVTSAKDLTTDSQSTKLEFTATASEGTTVRADAAKSAKDEDVVLQMENKKSSATYNYSVPDQSKNTETRSKEAAPAAAVSGKRETEFAEIRVDASQLQRAPLSEAIQLYAAGDYEQAFQKAEKFLKISPKDPEGLFYSGVSALSLQKEKVAAKRLEDCLATGAQQWKEESSWYLSLCYVKLGKSPDAKPLLEFLAAGNGPHAVEAKKMLESIH